MTIRDVPPETPTLLRQTAQLVHDGARAGVRYTAVRHSDGWRLILPGPPASVLDGGPWPSLSKAILRLPRPAADRGRKCKAPGCSGKHHAHGWCGGHYRRWVRTGDAREALSIGLPNSGRPRQHDECSVETCHEEHDAKGLCKRHYARWRQHGDYDVAPRETPAPTCTHVDGDGTTCSRVAVQRELCPRHYQRARHLRLIPDVPQCVHIGSDGHRCPHGQSATSLCANHYTAAWRRRKQQEAAAS